ncbi:MAG: hypothetical protein MZV64_68595 [Ignavibacteriales bacterium]|nr:hypothetical protein [Ignavibacteriales bacterium]
MTSALETVVNDGTAKSVRKFYNGSAAGKTGTTQNYADAWFCWLQSFVINFCVGWV